MPRPRVPGCLQEGDLRGDERHGAAAGGSTQITQLGPAYILRVIMTARVKRPSSYLFFVFYERGMTEMKDLTNGQSRSIQSGPLLSGAPK